MRAHFPEQRLVIEPMMTGATRNFFLRKMAYEQNNNSASVPFLDVYCVMDYDAKLPGSAMFFS